MRLRTRTREQASSSAADDVCKKNGVRGGIYGRTYTYVYGKKEVGRQYTVDVVQKN